jgi:hypothetical protein
MHVQKNIKGHIMASVIRDFYGKEESENVQTTAAASRNLHFATSFTVWPNQLYYVAKPTLRSRPNSTLSI